MTKLDLQKELLEKVKPGTKPSDIKRQVKPSPKPVNQDEGYESDKSDKSVPVAPPLLNQDLLNQIASLKKQLDLYKSFKEADLKIKEKLKEEIQELQQELADTQTRLRASFDERSMMNKTIAKLKSQAKPTEEPQPQEIKTFLCSSCQQTKPTLELSRAFNNFSFCLECSKKARQQAQQEKSEPKEFLCHSCQQTYQTTPNKMKLDSTLQTYLICSPCRPTLKEFNEADLITDDL
jgi:chorismate mutase